MSQESSNLIRIKDKVEAKSSSKFAEGLAYGSICKAINVLDGLRHIQHVSEAICSLEQVLRKIEKRRPDLVR